MSRNLLDASTKEEANPRGGFAKEIGRRKAGLRALKEENALLDAYEGTAKLASSVLLTVRTQRKM